MQKNVHKKADKNWISLTLPHLTVPKTKCHLYKELIQLTNLWKISTCRRDKLEIKLDLSRFFADILLYRNRSTITHLDHQTERSKWIFTAEKKTIWQFLLH